LLSDNTVISNDLEDLSKKLRDAIGSAPGTTTIHHSSVRDDTEAKNFTFLQYWMFMNFSRSPFGIPFGFSGNVFHEGDVEHLQITVRHALPDDQETEQDESKLKKFWLLPFAATASQHFYAQTLKWDIRNGKKAKNAHSQSFVEHKNQRLAIYIALGAHATYLAEDDKIDVPDFNARLGTVEQYDASPNGAFDKVDSTTKTEYSLLSLENSFLGTFKGRWGFFVCDEAGSPTEKNGPPGPPNRFALDMGDKKVILIREPKKMHNLTIKNIDGDDQTKELKIE